MIRLIVVIAIGMLVVVALIVIELPKSVEKAIYLFTWVVMFVSGLLYTLLSGKKAIWLRRKMKEKQRGGEEQ